MSGNRVGVLRSTGQWILWVCLVSFFCVSLIGITRMAPPSTLLICGLAPVVLLLFGLLRFPHSRGAQLFWIESIYMFLASVSILAITFGWPTLNLFAGIGFLLFFVLQMMGFLIDQVKRKTPPMGWAQTLLGGGALLFWGLTTSFRSTIDGDGRFQMWGENAPGVLQGIYVLWVADILLNGRSLPKLTSVSAHLVSITIAVFSGQFFFARLLTASQLFLLDGLVRFSGRDFVGLDFMVMDEARLLRWRRRYRKHLSKALFVVFCALFLIHGFGLLSRLGVGPGGAVEVQPCMSGKEMVQWLGLF